MKKHLRQTAEKLFYQGLLMVLRSVGLGSGKPRRKLVVFKPDRIGDFVLSSGALHLLCQEFGPQEITLAVSTMLEPLVKREFPGCQIVSIQQPSGQWGDNWRRALVPGWRWARRSNKRRSYDQLVNLRHHPTLFEDLLLGSFRAVDSYGTRLSRLGGEHWLRGLRSFNPQHECQYPAKSEDLSSCLELEAHRRVVEKLLNRTVGLSEIMPVLSGVTIKDDGYLLIVPFGSDRVRDYPETSMVQGIQAAGLPGGVTIIICGEISRLDSLKNLATALQQALPNPIQLVHPANLLEFVEYVARAHCVISAESAAAHITTALDKRGVFIIGGGHYGLFAPWTKSARQAWLQLPMDCYGCDWQCIHPTVKCIQDLPPSHLAVALGKHWNLT